MTISETLFEKFCSNSEIKCVPIQLEKSRTPDYEILIDEKRIIVEIKEIERNKEEKASLRLHGFEEGHGIPGDRIRAKINKACTQIKNRSKGIYPSILVLVDLTWGGHLDPYYIRVAMYGLEQIHMNIPVNLSKRPYITGIDYGPKRKMTQDNNTSISAIGVLSATNKKEILLQLYHNRYAAVPLDHNLLKNYRIEHFRLEEEPDKTAKWEKLD
jgi:hypothetical protein